MSNGDWVMHRACLYDIWDRIVAVPMIVIVLGIACGVKALTGWRHS